MLKVFNIESIRLSLSTGFKDCVHVYNFITYKIMLLYHGKLQYSEVNNK